MKKVLIVIAGLLWMFTGFMVTKIGLEAYIELNANALFFIPISILIFYLFYFKIFSPLQTKNVKRIMSLQDEELKLWKFLDKKSYIIMIFMMTFGIVLRKFANLPALFLFIFYTGLGVALFAAGLKYFVEKKQIKEVFRA
ncbi:hypothetical protein ABID14_000004 [Peptoniphilus olsenii]|uniref:Uncharacterized protein n=1 Tax=Peptoniphilus olsenii TaxID=411570 RepID=A0ABV2J9B1_9FIRM